MSPRKKYPIFGFGKVLPTTKLPVVKFKKIPCQLPELPTDISTDQKYLSTCVLLFQKESAQMLSL